MANQRPIRRAPHARWRWRRGSRRPRRWLDGFSSRATETNACSMEVADVSCDPQPAIRTLFYGDTDWDWSDRSEVLVDGIIGRIHWDAAQFTNSGSIVIAHPQMLRLGILAVEDADALSPTIDLFDNEVREEYEWMWLYSSLGDSQFAFDGQGTGVSIYQQESIDVNIRTRRKLGKKDAIFLFAQTKIHSRNNQTGITFRLPVLSQDLRAIIKS